jgi:hypothetical protein
MTKRLRCKGFLNESAAESPLTEIVHAVNTLRLTYFYYSFRSTHAINGMDSMYIAQRYYAIFAVDKKLDFCIRNVAI